MDDSEIAKYANQSADQRRWAAKPFDQERHPHDGRDINHLCRGDLYTVLDKSF
jgi:hypothetical protein